MPTNSFQRGKSPAPARAAAAAKAEQFRAPAQSQAPAPVAAPAKPADSSLNPGELPYESDYDRKKEKNFIFKLRQINYFLIFKKVLNSVPRRNRRKRRRKSRNQWLGSSL